MVSHSLWFCHVTNLPKLIKTHVVHESMSLRTPYIRDVYIHTVRLFKAYTTIIFWKRESSWCLNKKNPNRVDKGLCTVLCISVGPRPHGLESRVIATQEPSTAFHGIKQKNMFLKKISKTATQKNYVFQNRQFSIFFSEIEQGK